MREKETGKNVTVYSAAVALRNLAEGEGNVVCASTHVHWAAAHDTRGAPHPHNGATLIPALCMWILDPDLRVDGEWGQQLI